MGSYTYKVKFSFIVDTHTKKGICMDLCEDTPPSFKADDEILEDIAADDFGQMWSDYVVDLMNSTDGCGNPVIPFLKDDYKYSAEIQVTVTTVQDFMGGDWDSEVDIDVCTFEEEGHRELF